MNTRTNRNKILLTAGAVTATALVAVLGTFAAFSNSEGVSNTIAAGTVDIGLSNAGPDNRLTVNASGLVPGDSLQRRVRLTNTGSENLAAVTLTTAADPSSELDTDATNGLQMKIEKCGGALGWRESGSAPYTYTCDSLDAGDNLGVRSTVLARRAIIGSGIALSNMASVTAGQADDMVVTVDLPETAPNSMQGDESSIAYTFSATQRAGGAK